mmetsp:Transcript_50273/g.143787  ORF Transcript_50273/g.143787 Transcript_50273/m.143787 type:complete len:276 (-) Transcript_50273:823-1650(-)
MQRVPGGQPGVRQRRRGVLRGVEGIRGAAGAAGARDRQGVVEVRAVEREVRRVRLEAREDPHGVQHRAGRCHVHAPRPVSRRPVGGPRSASGVDVREEAAAGELLPRRDDRAAALAVHPHDLGGLQRLRPGRWGPLADGGAHRGGLRSHVLYHRGQEQRHRGPHERAARQQYFFPGEPWHECLERCGPGSRPDWDEEHVGRHTRAGRRGRPAGAVPGVRVRGAAGGDQDREGESADLGPAVPTVQGDVRLGRQEEHELPGRYRLHRSADYQPAPV